MRRRKAELLGEVLKRYVHEQGMARKLTELDVVSCWSELMGDMFTKFTSQIYIRHQVLYIHLTSSIAKSELLMLQNEIISKFNEKAKYTLVKRVVIR